MIDNIISFAICILFLFYIFYRIYLSYNSKFELGENLATKINDIDNSKSVIYLDRHNIECPIKSGINKFKFINNSNNKINYDYTCSKGGNLEDNIIVKETPKNEGLTAMVNLDRHDVKCDSNQILNQFRLIRPDSKSINYKYSCISSKKPLQCRQLNTPLYNRIQIDNTNNLANLEPSCEKNEVIQSFKLIRNMENGKDQIGYQYTCCQ